MNWCVRNSCLNEDHTDCPWCHPGVPVITPTVLFETVSCCKMGMLSCYLWQDMFWGHSDLLVQLLTYFNLHCKLLVGGFLLDCVRIHWGQGLHFNLPGVKSSSGQMQCLVILGVWETLISSMILEWMGEQINRCMTNKQNLFRTTYLERLSIAEGADLYPYFSGEEKNTCDRSVEGMSHTERSYQRGMFFAFIFCEFCS